MAFKGLMGGAAGAALYTAYRDSDTILNSSDLVSGLFEYMRKGGGSSNIEMSRLQKNVDDLQHALLKSLHDRQPTVIYAGQNKGGLGTATGVILVVGGAALYIRFVKGWRFSDLMYVTRSSLSSMTESMKSGMESMKSQFEERARVMLERMHLLGTKQEELLEAQGHLGNELALVGGKVSAVSEQVGFSNHAILMLCGALSEMAKRVGISNGRYVKELENLSRSVHSLPPGPHMAALGGGLAAAGGAGAGLPYDTAAFFQSQSGAASAPAAAGASPFAPSPAMLPAPGQGFGPNPSMHAVTAGLSSVSGSGGNSAPGAAGGPAAAAAGVPVGGAGQAKTGGLSGLWGAR